MACVAGQGETFKSADIRIFWAQAVITVTRVARWLGGSVARWLGGSVARWLGGSVARSRIIDDCLYSALIMFYPVHPAHISINKFY